MFLLSLREKISESLSEAIGAPANQISLFLTMISVLPFCVLNYFIHGKYPRLIYSLVLGLFFQISIYKYNFIHIFISAIFTYLFIAFYGRKLSAFYVLIFSIVYLSYLHIKRMFEDYGGWTIDDPTTIYMMSICKFSSLAFSYEDGEKDINTIYNSHHREYRVVEKPTLLEVLSFIYFYPTSIVGPSIEFKDFINFINEADCYSNLTKNLGYLIKYSLLYFFGSFVAIAYCTIVTSKVPLASTYEEEFGKHNFLYKLAYLYLCFPGIRARYYSGWFMSYSGLILCGISYTEKKDKDGKIIKSLEKGNYGSVIAVEWNSIYPKEAINEWNKTIHLWLKYNVYLRVINIEHKKLKNNKSLASLITFICSAIWHGYYLTYYTTFFVLYCYQSGCLILEQKGVYDWIRKTKYLIPFVSVLNCVVIETIGIMFFNLEWHKAVMALKNYKYFPFIFHFGFFIFTKFLKVPKKPKNVDNTIKEKEKETTKKVE